MTEGQLPDVPALHMLEPPPGGLDALRDRLDRPPLRRWLFAIPIAALAAFLVWLAIPRQPRPPARVATAPQLLADPTIAGGGPFYWVSSVPSDQRRPRPVARPTVAVVSITDAPRVTVIAPR